MNLAYYSLIVVYFALYLRQSAEREWQKRAMDVLAITPAFVVMYADFFRSSPFTHWLMAG